jgi:hypothetical protein
MAKLTLLLRALLGRRTPAPGPAPLPDPAPAGATFTLESANAFAALLTRALQESRAAERKKI